MEKSCCTGVVRRFIAESGLNPALADGVFGESEDNNSQLYRLMS